MTSNFNTIEYFISKPRLSRYLHVSNNIIPRSLKLYQTNIRLSQSFYPLLSLLEIVLRNSINECLSKKFNDKNWILNQMSGFMVDPILGANPYFLREVNEAIKKLNRTKKKVTSQNVIANLTLGFWVSFFHDKNFNVLKGEPLKIFTNKPKQVNREAVKKSLEKIRDFRNRVYHNDPIIFSNDLNNNPIFTLFHIEETYSEIKNIFEYLDLDFKSWTRRIDNIPLEISRANVVISHYPGKTYYYHRLKVGVNHLRYKYSNN